MQSACVTAVRLDGQADSPATGIVAIAMIMGLLFWSAVIWGIVLLLRHLRRWEGRRGWSKSISTGAAGLILVSMRLLQFAILAAKDIGTFFWFVANIGTWASHVGLIVSIVGIVKNSGREAGIAGVIVWLVLAVVMSVLLH